MSVFHGGRKASMTKSFFDIEQILRSSVFEGAAVVAESFEGDAADAWVS